MLHPEDIHEAREKHILCEFTVLGLTGLLFLSLASPSLAVCVYLCFSVCLSVSLCVSLCVCLSVSLSLSLCPLLYVPPSVYIIVIKLCVNVLLSIAFLF